MFSECERICSKAYREAKEGFWKTNSSFETVPEIIL
jgi:hypothetical protein